MKGLLLKDWYVMARHCKVYLLLNIFLIVFSAMTENDFFVVFYPAVIAGILPVTLLGYDERAKWDAYCGALPLTKVQIVSEKYIVGILAQLAFGVMMALAQFVKMALHPAYGFRECMTVLAIFLLVFCVSAGICLPFMFKLGSEKGRIVYMFTIGIFCGIGAVATNLFENTSASVFDDRLFIPLFCVAGVAIYAFSWYLSVHFYRKRNI